MCIGFGVSIKGKEKILGNNNSSVAKYTLKVFPVNFCDIRSHLLLCTEKRKKCFYAQQSLLPCMDSLVVVDMVEPNVNFPLKERIDLDLFSHSWSAVSMKELCVATL